MEKEGFWVRHSGKIQASLSTVIKLILIISIAYSIYGHSWRVLFVDILLLMLVFAPYFLRKSLSIQIPQAFEWVILAFTIISFFLGDIKGFVIQAFFGLAVGFIGFVSMLIIYNNSKLKPNYLVIAIFSFSFAIALGLVSELIKYYLKIYLGFTVTIGDYDYAMVSLSLVGLGALISSTVGFFYMKGYRTETLQNLSRQFKRTNPNLFIEKTDSPEDVLELIKKGESERLEFKSTLRLNTHTNELDKNIEKSNLKTLVAFMNSSGGTLLIGINDQGSIEGIDKDRFESNDKYALHFTNLIKERIGNQYLPYINFEIFLLEGKYILKASCIKSDRPVFLREGKEEEFFIRIGSASVQLTGRKLIEYIQNNFRN